VLKKNELFVFSPRPSAPLHHAMALATTRFQCQGCNQIFAHDSFFQHLLTSDTSCLWDPEELCESDTLLFQVWQTYCEITSADGSNIFQCADFSTDIYIPDDLLNVLKDGIGRVPDTTDAACSFSASVFEILTDCVTVSGTAIPDVLRSKGLKVRRAQVVLRRKWSQGTGTLNDVGSALKSLLKTDVLQ